MNILIDIDINSKIKKKSKNIFYKRCDLRSSEDIKKLVKVIL